MRTLCLSGSLAAALAISHFAPEDPAAWETVLVQKPEKTL